jgi:rhamnulokinase
VRAELENIALKYRQVLERFKEVMGRRFAPIQIIGGGTKNRLLNQLTADSCGRTVEAGSLETIAIGNLLMLAITLGQLESLIEAQAVVRNSFDVESCHPDNRAGGDDAFEKL